MEDMVIAGISAATAGAICNPLEVVKIRLQLQGELKARGQYHIAYRFHLKYKNNQVINVKSQLTEANMYDNRNVFHAFYTIATKDGFFALQKGLVPFMLYQFSSNSIRLGSFQIMSQKGWTKNPDGSVNTLKTVFLATCGGALGGVVCSPFYLVIVIKLNNKVDKIIRT